MFHTHLNHSQENITKLASEIEQVTLFKWCNWIGTLSFHCAFKHMISDKIISYCQPSYNSGSVLIFSSACLGIKYMFCSKIKAEGSREVMTGLNNLYLMNICNGTNL